MFENLNDENFLIYALKFYDTPNCIMSEFENDMSRIQYIKRLMTKYFMSGEIKERLLLNHIVIVCNVFGPEAATRILFYKLDETYYPLLKTFLIYLNIMPEVVRGIRGQDIISSNINLDTRVVECLRKL
jgi:hypothetical protein